MIFSCIFEKNIHQLQKKLNARPYFLTVTDNRFTYYRSSPPEVFLGKGVLKIWSKFTWEQPCQCSISIYLLCNFIEFTYRHGCPPVNLLHNFWTSFPKNTSEGLLLLLVRYRFDIDANLQHGCIYLWLRKMSLNSNRNFVRIKILFLQDTLFEQLFLEFLCFLYAWQLRT